MNKPVVVTAILLVLVSASIIVRGFFSFKRMPDPDHINKPPPRNWSLGWFAAVVIESAAICTMLVRIEPGPKLWEWPLVIGTCGAIGFAYWKFWQDDGYHKAIAQDVIKQGKATSAISPMTIVPRKKMRNYWMFYFLTSLVLFGLYVTLMARWLI